MPYELYVITDVTIREGITHTRIAMEAVAGGADVIQLRDKDMSGRKLLATAREIRHITRNAGRLFIVNDRIDIAMASGADGVHLGQDDLPLAEARNLVHDDFIIGISVGSVYEAVDAEKAGADYVAVSPVFSTGTKKDAGAGLGTQRITAIRQRVSIPVIGIGGIRKENIHEVLQSGADGVAVVSAIIGTGDIVNATTELKSIIMQYKQSSKK